MRSPPRRWPSGFGVRPRPHSDTQYLKVRRKTRCHACRVLRAQRRSGPHNVDSCTGKVRHHAKFCLRTERDVIVPTGIKHKRAVYQPRMSFRVARRLAREPGRFTIMRTNDTGLVQKLWYLYLSKVFNIQLKTVWKRPWAVLSRVSSHALARGRVRAVALTLQRVFNTVAH